ncbi:MAG: prepilin-type N-terminal cleavage/methylation domain-containing protein [Deltaproteobacteria bacterium]|nr:prepilin-type N-terminal cleavage/methylation domain-containing protein [Deltaproteobacteria bacterium]
MKRYKGFTLIELLVVIALLAILASVAIPIYSSYMSASAKSEAKSNLQTLSMLLETYYTDNGKYSPASSFPTTYTWQNDSSGNVTTNGFSSWLTSFQPKKSVSGAVANYRYNLNATSNTAYTATAVPERGSVQGTANLTINESGTKTGW